MGAAAAAVAAAPPAAESGRWLSRFGLGGGSSADRVAAKHGAVVPRARSDGGSKSKKAAKKSTGFLARFHQRDNDDGVVGGGTRTDAKARRRSSLTAGTAVTVSRLRAMDPSAKLFRCRRLLPAAPQATDGGRTKQASAQLYPGRFLLVLGDSIVCVRGRGTPRWPLGRGADALTLTSIEKSIMGAPASLRRDRDACSLSPCHRGARDARD